MLAWTVHGEMPEAGVFGDMGIRGYCAGCPRGMGSLPGIRISRAICLPESITRFSRNGFPAVRCSTHRPDARTVIRQLTQALIGSRV